MPDITFILSNDEKHTVTAQENQSIMQIAREHNISGIEGVCGGCIACATCHVHIPDIWREKIASEDNEKSEEEFDMLELAPNNNSSSRLGCQVKITNRLNGLTVYIP